MYKNVTLEQIFTTCSEKLKSEEVPEKEKNKIASALLVLESIETEISLQT